jgi:orotate phosphoribosyltransferase
MSPAEPLAILAAHKAILRDTHVVYTSGRHGTTYVNKDAIYPNTEAVSALCAAIAAHFADAGIAIDVVAAPALGGIILSQWVAHHLTAGGRRALAVYAEKAEPEGFAFRRGYDRILQGRRVLVVEDILTTGGSLRSVIEGVRRAGGEVVGAAALCNRGGVRASEVGDPPELFALVELSLESWDEQECPLCASGMPVNTEVGKGAEFVRLRRSDR